jgi:hypothetical protein
MLRNPGTCFSEGAEAQQAAPTRTQRADVLMYIYIYIHIYIYVYTLVAQ